MCSLFSSLSLSLSSPFFVLLFSASLPFPLNLWLFLFFSIHPQHPTPFFILFSTLTLSFPFHALLLQLLVSNVQD